MLLSISVYITAYFGLVIASFFILTYFGNKDKMHDPAPSRFPFVSIVIPVFNEGKAIADTVKSLLVLDYPKNKYEIIIVDDGSTDDTYKVIKKFESLRVKVFTKENGGCAHALNFGLSKAQGELIARFDADTVLAKDALKKTIGYFDNPRVMAVTSSLNVLNHKGFLQKIQWAEYITGIFLRKMFDLNKAIHVIPGPLSVYRAKFFEKYGGFDESNITEDTEMAMRMQSHGYEIKNSIGANVYTLIPTNFLQLLKQRIRWFTGFLRNSWEYKHLFNAKRKDDLSLLILPASFITILLSFLSFFVLAFYSIRGLKNQIIRIDAAGFNFNLFSGISMQKVTNYLSSYSTGPYVFFLVSGILIAAFYFLLVKYYSGEKRGLFLTAVMFFIFYSFFFAIWWGSALFYFIAGKEVKWGPRSYIRGKMADCKQNKTISLKATI